MRGEATAARDGAGALAVLLCGAGAGRWPAQCDASLRDEDAADAPMRGAAFLVAFFLVPVFAGNALWAPFVAIG